MCPEGTTLDADATTGSIGECVHECHDYSTYSQVDNHICFALIRDDSFDWSNNTCGVGNCDTHTTPDACAASDGYWRDEEMFSEQTCPAIQGVLSWVSYASGREGGGEIWPELWLCRPWFRLARPAAPALTPKPSCSAAPTTCHTSCVSASNNHSLPKSHGRLLYMTSACLLSCSKQSWRLGAIVKMRLWRL